MKINQVKANRIYYMIDRLGSFNKPVKSTEMERVMFMRGETLRNCVMDMRRNGKAISSDRRGYWIAQNQVEFASTLTQLQNRANSLNKTIEAMSDTMNSLPEGG